MKEIINYISLSFPIIIKYIDELVSNKYWYKTVWRRSAFQEVWKNEPNEVDDANKMTSFNHPLALHKSQIFFATGENLFDDQEEVNIFGISEEINEKQMRGTAHFGEC